MFGFHRISSLLGLAIVVLAVSARAETSPEDVLGKSFQLMASDCDYACCYELAGLHSRRFLAVLKDATLASIESGGAEDGTLADTFGLNIDSIENVDSLTPREVFARSTCNTIKTMPIEFRYTKFEIIRTERPNPETIEYYVRLSGLQASPNMTEESFYRLVQEDGAWRIDQ
ncbi:MAG: hypothetical protein ACN4GT_11700 [Gammaproteobacteria bacterium]